MAAEPIRLVSDEQAALIELLRGCNKALDLCSEAHADKDALVRAQLEQNTLLRGRVMELEKAQSGILKEPLFWVAVGVFATGMTVYLVKPN